MADVAGYLRCKVQGVFRVQQVSTQGASVTTYWGLAQPTGQLACLPVSEGACCQHSTYYFSIWHQETHNARGSCVHQREPLFSTKKSLSVVDDLHALDIKVNNKITGNASSNNSLVKKNMEDNAP